MVKTIFGGLLLIAGLGFASFSTVLSTGSGSMNSTCTTTQSGSGTVETCNYYGRALPSDEIDRLIVAGIGVGLIIGGSTVIAGSRSAPARPAAPQPGWAGSPPPPPPGG